MHIVYLLFTYCTLVHLQHLVHKESFPLHTGQFAHFSLGKLQLVQVSHRLQIWQLKHCSLGQCFLQVWGEQGLHASTVANWLIVDMEKAKSFRENC